MTQERELLKAWGDDVALRGSNAPKNDGSIKHMIEYLLTVYERFGNTTITANLQWGATALWKRDEAQQRVAELEAELEALRITPPEASFALPAEPTEEIIDAMCEGYTAYFEMKESGRQMAIGENLANVYRALRAHLALPPSPQVAREEP